MIKKAKEKPNQKKKWDIPNPVLIIIKNESRETNTDEVSAKKCEYFLPQVLRTFVGL